MKEIWCNLDGLPKNKELWSYVVKFEFISPKSSSVSGNHDYVIYSNTSVMLASKKYSNNRKEGRICFI